MTLVKTFPVVYYEFKEILKYVSVVSVKLQKDGEFYVLPIISIEDTTLDVLITTKDIKAISKVGQSVFIKSFRFGFEFIIKGKIVAISDANIMRFEVFEVRRIRNYRQFIRYDVNLIGRVRLMGKKTAFDIKIKDISLDGASFNTSFGDFHTLDEAEVDIVFDSGSKITLKGNILRDIKTEYAFSGIEFIGLSDNVTLAFKEELRGIEKAHLLPLGMVRKYLNKTKVFNKKVALYSTNCDVIYYVIGLIFLIGIQNYEVYNDFRRFKTDALVEKPDVVLVEVEKMNDDILCVIKYTRERLKGTPIVVVLPFNFQDKIHIYQKELEGVTILHKPIAESQLEECLRELKVID